MKINEYLYAYKCIRICQMTDSLNEVKKKKILELNNQNFSNIL